MVDSASTFTTEDMAERVQRPKKGGKYCVAGGPKNVSCKNCTYTPDVSMHVFPKDETTRRLWVKFVRKHRPDFKPSQSSALCSVHFEPTCYTRLSIMSQDHQSKGKRILLKGSIPTRDTVAPFSTPEASPRERKKVSAFIVVLQVNFRYTWFCVLLAWVLVANSQSFSVLLWTNDILF